MEKICDIQEGRDEVCERFVDGKCNTYAAPPSFYVRGGKCPFNMPIVKTAKSRRRVGQQKTKRVAG